MIKTSMRLAPSKISDISPERNRESFGFRALPDNDSRTIGPVSMFIAAYLPGTIFLPVYISYASGMVAHLDIA